MDSDPAEEMTTSFKTEIAALRACFALMNALEHQMFDHGVLTTPELIETLANVLQRQVGQEAQPSEN